MCYVSLQVWLKLSFISLGFLVWTPHISPPPHSPGYLDFFLFNSLPAETLDKSHQVNQILCKRILCLSKILIYSMHICDINLIFTSLWHFYSLLGNYYQQGNIRKKELFSSCSILGIPTSHVTVKDHQWVNAWKFH